MGAGVQACVCQRALTVAFTGAWVDESVIVCACWCVLVCVGVCVCVGYIVLYGAMQFISVCSSHPPHLSHTRRLNELPALHRLAVGGCHIRA